MVYQTAPFSMTHAGKFIFCPCIALDRQKLIVSDPGITTKYWLYYIHLSCYLAYKI